MTERDDMTTPIMKGFRLPFQNGSVQTCISAAWNSYRRCFAPGPACRQDEVHSHHGAIQHKQKALSLYTPLLSNITQSNAAAIFAFSCLLTILSFASQASDLTRTVNDIDGIVDIFRLVRGVAVVVLQERDSIECSEMSILLRKGHFTSPDHHSSSNLGTFLEAELQSLLRRHPTRRRRVIEFDS